MKTMLALFALALAPPLLAPTCRPRPPTCSTRWRSLTNSKSTPAAGFEYGKGEDVKKFAQQMIDDHTKAGEEFKAAVKGRRHRAARRRARHKPPGYLLAKTLEGIGLLCFVRDTAWAVITPKGLCLRVVQSLLLRVKTFGVGVIGFGLAWETPTVAC